MTQKKYCTKALKIEQLEIGMICTGGCLGQ